MKAATFNIKKIVIVRRSGHTDSITITTDLPSPFPPNIATDNLTISFEVPRKHGEEYIRKNFNIEPELIDVS